MLVGGSFLHSVKLVGLDSIAFKDKRQKQSASMEKPVAKDIANFVQKDLKTGNTSSILRLQPSIQHGHPVLLADTSHLQHRKAQLHGNDHESAPQGSGMCCKGANMFLITFWCRFLHNATAQEQRHHRKSRIRSSTAVSHHRTSVIVGRNILL